MKLSRKTWLLIGIAVAALVWFLMKTRESFTSGAQMQLFFKKFESVKNSPHFQAVNSFPNAQGPKGPDMLSVAFRYILPLQAVGLYGDVTGDDLQIKQSQLESMLNGTFPIDSVLTLDKAYEVSVLMRQERDPGYQPTAQDKQKFMSDESSTKTYVNLPKGLYSVFARGKAASGLSPKETSETLDALNDPNNKVMKPWTEEEKQWLRTAAGMFYKVIPDAPAAPAVAAPSAPPSAAGSAASAYSASCSKCTMVNNQLTCTCDVLPK